MSRFGTFIGKIKGILFNDELEQSTWYSPIPHQHFSGHSIATLAGRITNHNQNVTAGNANSSNTNTTVIRDGIANCCNQQRQRI